MTTTGNGTWGVDVSRPLHQQVEERAVRRAYRRIYPGLLWENASDVGRAEAVEALSPDDVLAVIESMEVLGQVSATGMDLTTEETK